MTLTGALIVVALFVALAAQTLILFAIFRLLQSHHLMVQDWTRLQTRSKS